MENIKVSDGKKESAREINLQALFTDETDNFLTPSEPLVGGMVQIRFRTAKDNVDNVTLLCEDGEFKLTKTLTDDYFDYYGIYVELSDKLFEYNFRVETDRKVIYYDKMGPTKYPINEHQFKIIPGFKTPHWAKGAVMYQIYTDRFYNGDESNDVESDEYNYIGEHVVKSTDWYKYPDPMDVRTFYGGDIKGVMDKLEYLEKLGVQVIYFNPLFVSPSNHKYDASDYDNIDPHIGVIVNDGGELLEDGDDDNSHATRYIKRVTDKENLEASNRLFAELVEKAHSRNIKVIIDGVFNHCGSFNKWLDREGIYAGTAIKDEKGAYISKDSKYRNYFRFKEKQWPNNESYEGWWGHETLPKLNYEGSKDLEEYILDIGRKWVSPPYNADGWRLDVAADLGCSPEYNHKFWAKFRDAVKEANSEAIILAEHYGDVTSWLQGDEWDTVMNYDAFMEPITWFLTGMEKHSDGKDEYLKGNGEHFAYTMLHNMARFTYPSLFTAMNQISNHDHSRFLTRTNETVGRTNTHGPDAANRGVRKSVMKEAVVMQMTWPGAPTVYYGDEAGLCGWTDPDNRRCYPWGREDLELLEFHRDMIRIRRVNPALTFGSLKMLRAERNLHVYGRFIGDNKMAIVINNDEAPKDIDINVWEIGITGDTEMIRIMITSEVCYNAGIISRPVKNGVLSVHIPGKTAAVYKDINETL